MSLHLFLDIIVNFNDLGQQKVEIKTHFMKFLLNSKKIISQPFSPLLFLIASLSNSFKIEI